VKVFTWPRRHVLRASCYALVLILATLSGVSLGGSAASAAASTDGFVRLAHLSPDTPSVDVYLNALTFSMKQQVFDGVSYGTVSAYEMVPAGSYSVAMRLSGAKPSSPAVLSTNVKVVAGHAYTVAGVGKNADLGLRVIPDDLSSPLDGKAMVRIVQASIKAPLLDVSVQGGAAIATNVPFATTTSYRSVDPGVLTLLVGPSGGRSIPVKVTLAADSVYSVLVLDGKKSLTAQLRTDAVSKGTPPTGGVATGGGGMSGHRLFMPAIYVAVGALLLMLLIVFRRGGQDRWSARRQPSRSL
jgi:hypothetical protein